MEKNERVVCEKAVLVGLNADCFKPEEIGRASCREGV